MVLRYIYTISAQHFRQKTLDKHPFKPFEICVPNDEKNWELLTGDKNAVRVIRWCGFYRKRPAVNPFAPDGPINERKNAARPVPSCFSPRLT